MTDGPNIKLIAVATLAAGAIALGVVLTRDHGPEASAVRVVAVTAGGSPIAPSSATDASPDPAQPAPGVLPLPAARASSTSAFMPDLRRAADAGDPAAACKLAMELHGCIEVQEMEVAATSGDGLRDSPEQPLATVAAHHSRCSIATDAELEDQYRYQAQAFASGDPEVERWFIQAPLLNDYDFESNSPNAVDYRRRAQAYVGRAIQRKDVEDLRLLLEVYKPPRVHSMSRLRIRDDAMFLALADMATQTSAIEDHDRALAAQVRRKAGADVLARVAQRAAQVGGGWSKAPVTSAARSDPCAALKRP